MLQNLLIFNWWCCFSKGQTQLQNVCVRVHANMCEYVCEIEKDAQKSSNRDIKKQNLRKIKL